MPLEGEKEVNLSDLHENFNFYCSTQEEDKEKTHPGYFDPKVEI
jgi:hypothetical protein